MSLPNTSPPNTAANSPAPLHLGWLDSLRAFAALYVMIQHTASITMPSMGGFHGATLLLVGPFRFGHWAVDLFIILSGFCLMLPVTRGDGHLRGGAWLFFRKRARRILPPYYCALALSVGIWLLFGHSIKLQWGRVPSVSWGGLWPSLFMLQDVFIQHFNPAFWSVAVEWRIYFAFPLLVWLWRRIGPLPTTLLSMGVALALFLLLRHSLWINIMPSYLALFVFGMLAATSAQSQRGMAAPKTNSSVFAIAALLLVGLALNYKWRSDLTKEHVFLVDLLGGAGIAWALVVLARAKSRARLLLDARAPVFVGTYAYSIYLIHMPLLVLSYHYAVQPLRLSPLASYGLLLCLGLPLVLGVSYLFFLACERPFLNTKRRETLAETARDAALSPAP